MHWEKDTKAQQWIVQSVVSIPLCRHTSLAQFILGNTKERLSSWVKATLQRVLDARLWSMDWVHWAL